jgi:predicted ATPase with chaperone activity
VSDIALVGGGEVARPGEVSLAHHGVLFLDELAELRRPALEALRQPLEGGVVTICVATDWERHQVHRDRRRPDHLLKRGAPAP